MARTLNLELIPLSFSIPLHQGLFRKVEVLEEVLSPEKAQIIKQNITPVSIGFNTWAKIWHFPANEASLRNKCKRLVILPSARIVSCLAVSTPPRPTDHTKGPSSAWPPSWFGTQDIPN